jgi:hypothetical protein
MESIDLIFNGLIQARTCLNRKMCDVDLAPYTRQIVEAIVFSGEKKEFYEVMDKFFDFFMEECKFFPNMPKQKIVDAKEEATSLIALYALDRGNKYQQFLQAYNILKGNL